MPGAASSAAFNASAESIRGTASPRRAATPVRTSPIGASGRAATAPWSRSSASIASVTIITSQGTPPSSASRIAPTAPKRPSIVAPPAARNRSRRASTRPLTAPAQSSCSRLLIRSRDASRRQLRDAALGGERLPLGGDRGLEGREFLVEAHEVADLFLGIVGRDVALDVVQEHA